MECLVGPDLVVDVAEEVDLDVEGVGFVDESAVEVLVFQCLEVSLVDAVGLRAAHSGSDVAKQRVLAGE